jgi:glycine cleavage system H protein
MIKVKPSSPTELDGLLDSAKYTKHCEEEDAH